MIRHRIIPVILLHGTRMVKTQKFKNPVYLGDPINVVRIFSEKEADEIVILDIDASVKGREPQYDFLEQIATEAFMPVSYGGGVRTIAQIQRLLRLGVEKVIVNTAVLENKDVVMRAAEFFGSQAIVGGVDIMRQASGNRVVVTKSRKRRHGLDFKKHINELVEAGVGEIFVNNVDRDGCMAGYDLDVVREVADVGVPVVMCGGAGSLVHMREVIENGAAAAAAGSMFVFKGRNRAVLISYPDDIELEREYVR